METNDYYNQASKRAAQQRKILLSSPDFITDTEEVRRKRHIPKVDFNKPGDDEKLSKWHDNTDGREFETDISSILKKYKLDSGWRPGIAMYITWNNPLLLVRKLTLDVRQRVNKDTGLSEIWLKVDADTTSRDVKLAWKLVKQYQKNLGHRHSNKFQPFSDEVFERNKRAFQLRQEGKKYSEIADIFNQDYEAVYGDYDIQSMVRRHKKRIGIN